MDTVARRLTEVTVRSRSRRVLIVEDNPDGRETLRELLELMGHDVEVASDGLEGVEKGLTSPPDVALVDIGLPRMDGYQVAERLRSALGPKVVLVAYTAYDQPEDRLRAYRSGFDAHLAKPVDLEELTEWLNTSGSHYWRDKTRKWEFR
jgi:CheY-like chemotaxis protein